MYIYKHKWIPFVSKQLEVKQEHGSNIAGHFVVVLVTPTGNAV